MTNCKRCGSDNVSPWTVEDVEQGRALYSAICRDCEHIMYQRGTMFQNGGKQKRDFYKDREAMTQLDRAFLKGCGIKA